MFAGLRPHEVEMSHKTSLAAMQRQDSRGTRLKVEKRQEPRVIIGVGRAATGPAVRLGEADGFERDLADRMSRIGGLG